jgi:hypothetical protein
MKYTYLEIDPLTIPAAEATAAMAQAPPAPAPQATAFPVGMFFFPQAGQ